MPYIKIIMAMTADGKTADSKGRWKPLCKYELNRFKNSLEWADAIIVGATTVKHSDLPFIPEKNSNLIRIVLDASLSLTPKYRVFETSKHPTAVLTSIKNKDKKIIEDFKKKGVKLHFLVEKQLFSARKIVELVQQEYKAEKILVIGGGKTNFIFFEENLFNEYQITITPYILGSSPYTPVGHGSFNFPGKRLRIKTVKLCECGQEVVITYT